tara:strand:+ start:4055 stop:4729 length:675 start_codon:yes stop_codon:yes gene_type:complete
MNNREDIPKKQREPWPIKEVMEQVYAMKLWGGRAVDFYSGSGSHDSELVTPYIEVLTSFLTSFKSPITLCDLGCGDFNVGKDLVKYTSKYIAVDIVPDLIERNRKKFKEDHLEFHCLDVVADDLPEGDCALVRQVLQHLSNSEVQRIVDKLSEFKYVILTEHLPDGAFEANKDIITGQGIRLKKQSGIDLLCPPFNFKVLNEKVLLSVAVSDHKGVIVTTLYET